MSKPSRFPWIVVGLIAYVIVGAIAVEIGAGYVFFFLNKKMPAAFQADLFIQSWHYYNADHAQHKKLVLSVMASAALVFGFPLFVYLSGLNRPRDLHGSARFANASEINKAGLYAEKGIILGKYRGRYLIMGGSTFALLAAPTRSMKGVAVVIPNLLNWPDSVVVLDVKYENFLYTSGFRAANGQTIFLFAPFAESGETHRWNPLGFVRRGSEFMVDDLLEVAHDLWADGDDAKANFFNGLARDLFVGVAGLIDQTPELPFTLAECLRQCSGGGSGKDVKDYLKDLIKTRSEEGKPLPRFCLDSLSRFMAASESPGTGGSIKATVNEGLSLFASPLVEAATGASDFDVADLRRRRISIYLGIPPNKLVVGGRLMNMFFSQLLRINTRELPESDPSLKYQCLVMPDEMTALDRITLLAKSTGFMAGYGLRLFPIVQSVAQIRKVYKDETDGFIANFDTKIIYAPNEQKDANEFSETLGYFTQREKSRNKSRGTGASRGGSYGEGESSQKRALMMPQELRELPDDKEILIIRGKKPILCDKSTYYDDPVFVDRLKSVSPSLNKLGKKLPTEAQLKNVAFVLKELSVAIPKQARLSSPMAKVEVNSIELSVLSSTSPSMPIVLPELDDSESPSPESINTLVESFFSQCEWEPSESESVMNAPDAEPQKDGAPQAALIDVSVLG